VLVVVNCQEALEVTYWNFNVSNHFKEKDCTANFSVVVIPEEIFARLPPALPLGQSPPFCAPCDRVRVACPKDSAGALCRCPLGTYSRLPPFCAPRDSHILLSALIRATCAWRQQAHFFGVESMGGDRVRY
jgi:hypothetical protein